MAPADKLWHFGTSFVGVIGLTATFSILVRVGVFHWTYRRRVVVATANAFFVGLLKELGDGWIWTWPWCPCLSELNDLLANVLGIIMAVIGLLQLQWMHSILARDTLSQRAASATSNQYWPSGDAAPRQEQTEVPTQQDTEDV